MGNNTESTPNNLLISKSGSSCFVQEHPEFFVSLKSALGSATKLLEAKEGKIFIRRKSNKLLVVKKSSEKLLSLERQIAINAISKGRSQSFFRQEDIFDPNGKMVGRTSHSYLVAPFKTDTGQFGAILLKEKKIAGYFNQDDLKLLVTFTNTFASLVENSRMSRELLSLKSKISGQKISKDDTDLIVDYSLAMETLLQNNYLYRKHQEDAFQLAEIMKVSKMINSTLDIRSLLEAIMDSAKHVLRSEGSSLMLIDHNTNELYFNVISGEKERALKEMRIPIGVGIAGICAKEQKPFIINDAQNDSRVYKNADQTINFVTRNILCAPLMVKNKIIGVIEVINSLGRGEFTEKDLELFMTFSDHAALAIHNRDLIDNLKNINLELKKKIHELSSLHEVGKVLISARTEKDLFDSVVHILVDELEVERVSVLVYNDDEAMLEIISHFGMPRDILKSRYIDVNKSVSGIAFNDNKSIFITDIDDSFYAPFSKRERYSTGSFIIEPLGMNNKPFGLLCVGDKSNGTPLDDDDYRLVSTIAAQIIKAYENFALNREMIEKKAAEKELDVASQIQNSILPKHSMVSKYFEMGIKAVPAKTMGGDFYDYYQLDEDHYAFLVADVSGKSLPAALFMAVAASIIRTIFRTKDKELSKPDEVLNRANELIYENSESGMFVTSFFVRYDFKNGKARFASAGHNEQIVYRHKTDSFELLRGKGSPLGVLPKKIHGPYGSGDVHLDTGDLLVLYTDGVVEAINELKDEFGLDRFQEVLRSVHNLSPDQIVKRVYREVLNFAGHEPQFDDFTLFIIKRT